MSAEHRSRRAFVAAICIVAFVALVDYVTEGSLSFALFYLVPVLVAAWWGGRSLALATALIAAATEFTADYYWDDLPLFAAAWNNGSRLVIFLVAAVVVDRVRIERRRLVQRAAEREQFLGLLEREFPRPVTALLALAERLDRDRHLLPTELADLADAIQDGVHEVAFLGTDLLAIGGVQGVHQFAEHTVDIAAVTRAVASESPDPRRVVLLASPQPIALGDNDRLRHALASVVGRALEATTTGHVTIFVRESEAEVAIEVAYRGAIEERDLTLARLLLAGQHGRITLVERTNGNRIQTLWLRRASPVEVGD